MRDFASLHVHYNTGSVGDSVLKVKQAVAKAKQLGMKYIAMTDHGSLSAMVEFHEECKAQGITGIIGMEAYVTEDRTCREKIDTNKNRHLILLAKNAEGVKNLIRIHNDAQINGFYSKPRTDLSVLRKYGKNLIGLSACISGEIPKLLLEKRDVEAAVKKINEYKEVFDEFYLEVQPAHFWAQIKVNEALAVLSKATNTPLVATNDVHYLNKEDYLMHNTHVKRNENSDIHKLAYPDKCYYLMDGDEMAEYFPKREKDTKKHLTRDMIEEAIANTIKIAEQCDGEIDYDFKMPKYPDLPVGETEASWLTKLCIRELRKKEQSISDPAKYQERLCYELDTIIKLGFPGYFLIVTDFLKHAKEVGIAVGPGRGSVGGSLVAWLLGITVADPVKYDLLFERFLSPNRKGLPDIDMDFSADRRGDMIDYVIQKYGKEHTARVGAFQITKVKAAITNAGRMLEMPLDEVAAIKKTIPFNVKNEVGEKITDPSFKDILADINADKFRQAVEDYPELFKLAMDIESHPSAMSIHAAGVVITPDNLMNKIPVRVDKKTGCYVSTIDKHYIEKIGIKYDFLPLQTAELVDRTCQDAGVVIDLNDDSFFEDKEVWAAIGSTNTTGMFQINSDLYKQHMPRLHPTNLQELAACLALVRGPCIAAGTDEIYMDVVNHKREIERIDPAYDEVTKNTNGICIYQEEVMALGVAYGFTLDESYKLMKAISKKKADVIAKMKPTFYRNAIDRGVDPEKINRIWKVIEDAGLYSFNQAHAISYGMLTYISAWVKVHYPLHFMANTLTAAYEAKKDAKKTREMIADCQRQGIQFLPVDVNKSEWRFSVEGNKIRIGLCAIKAFGEGAAKELIDMRPIFSFQQVLDKYAEKSVQLNKKALGGLVCLDTFEGLVESHREAFRQMAIVKGKTKAERAGDVKVDPIFSPCTNCEIDIDKTSAKDVEELLLKTNFIHRSGASLPPARFNARDNGERFTALVEITKTKKHKDKRGNEMVFLDLAASDGIFDGVIFGSTYAKLDKKIIRKGKSLRIECKKDNDSCIIFSAEEVAA